MSRSWSPQPKHIDRLVSEPLAGMRAWQMPAAPSSLPADEAQFRAPSAGGGRANDVAMDRSGADDSGRASAGAPRCCCRSFLPRRGGGGGGARAGERTLSSFRPARVEDLLIARQRPQLAGRAFGFYLSRKFRTSNSNSIPEKMTVSKTTPEF